jgi:hypothetical protein
VRSRPSPHQAALDALVSKSRELRDLLTHAIDIKESPAVIARLRKRQRKVEQQMARIAKKVRP